MRVSHKSLWLVLLMVAGLGACRATFGGPSGYVTVSSAPPRPIVEVQPPRPTYDAIWIEGYWAWAGGRWVWSAGHWEVPRTGYVWVVPHYEYRNGRHYYVSGGWRQDKSYVRRANRGYGNAQGSSGYRTSQPRCPKGYVWTNNVCRVKYPYR